MSFYYLFVEYEYARLLKARESARGLFGSPCLVLIGPMGHPICGQAPQQSLIHPQEEWDHSTQKPANWLLCLVCKCRQNSQVLSFACHCPGHSAPRPLSFLVSRKENIYQPFHSLAWSHRTKEKTSGLSKERFPIDKMISIPFFSAYKMFKESADETKLKWNQKEIFILISLHLSFFLEKQGTYFCYLCPGAN